MASGGRIVATRGGVFFILPPIPRVIILGLDKYFCMVYGDVVGSPSRPYTVVFVESSASSAEWWTDCSDIYGGMFFCIYPNIPRVFCMLRRSLVTPVSEGVVSVCDCLKVFLTSKFDPAVVVMDEGRTTEGGDELPKRLFV